MVVSGPMHCNGGDKVRWPGTCSKVSLGIIYRYYMQVLSAGSIFGYYLKVLSIVIIYRKPFPGNIYISTGIIYRYFLQILSTDIIYKYYLQILSTDIIYRYYKQVISTGFIYRYYLPALYTHQCSVCRSLFIYRFWVLPYTDCFLTYLSIPVTV